MTNERLPEVIIVPPPIRKRVSDPDDFDPAQARYYHGPPTPDEFVNGNEVKVGWGAYTVGLKGPMTITVILLVVLGAITFYFASGSSREHGRQLNATNIGICVALYDTEERKAFREAWKNNPKAPQWWCPNVGGD